MLRVFIIIVAFVIALCVLASATLYQQIQLNKLEELVQRQALELRVLQGLERMQGATKSGYNSTPMGLIESSPGQ